MLRTVLDTKDISDVFAKFSQLIGPQHWRRRIKSIKEELRGNRFLNELLLDENEVAFALDRCSELTQRHGTLPPQETQNPNIYPAIAFAAQVLSIVEHCTHEQVQQLVRRIHGAFRDPDSLRGMRLELLAATHFVKRGYSIVWPEMENLGTFDLLVRGIGHNALEVECKAFSYDKGRKIHRREALEFYKLVLPRLQRNCTNVSCGLSVVLTVPQQLPQSFTDRKALAREISRVILSGRSTLLVDGGMVRISQFDVQACLSGIELSHPKIRREAIDKITGTTNREGVLLGTQHNGAVAFVLQSAQDDEFMRYAFDKLGDAANRQLTKTTAGLLVAGLDGITSEGLAKAAEQDSDPRQPPTRLRWEVSKFLKSDERDHLVGVAFLSRDAVTPTTEAETRSGGVAYNFQKQESRFWHTDFGRLFT